MFHRRLVLAFTAIFVLPGLGLAAGVETPKVERVVPASPEPLADAPGVFFHESFESIPSLDRSFHDLGTDNGRFRIENGEALSGGRALVQTYIPLTQYTAAEDPGSAGWAWRMFGDSPYGSSLIPADQKHPFTTIVARWYHKFAEGFQPRDGKYFPPKMARLRCFTPDNWSGMYSIYFWIGGEDGHLSIERKTDLPQAHRDWQPNFEADFRFSDPVNVGRWIHFELRLELGQGTRADRVQAWADGLLVCDVAGDDLAAGWREFTPNGMAWDCYWNGGSPVEQSRYYDDVMLSTERVGPLRTGANPVLVKSAFASSEPGAAQAGWEAEVAQAGQPEPEVDQVIDRVVTRFRQQEPAVVVVWRGRAEGDSLRLSVDTLHGEFTGPRAGASGLAPNRLHLVRLRQKDQSGNWSGWSKWHSGFATLWEPGTPPSAMTLPEGYLAETRSAVLGADDTPPVIELADRPVGQADTSGPYRVTVRVVEDNPLGVYLHWRTGGETDFSYVRMSFQDGVYVGEIPGQPAGTTVEYYVQAVDGFDHYAFSPADYAARPYVFRVLDAAWCDLNRDGRVNVLDVVCLLLRGKRNSADPALDYDGDGVYGLGDVLALLSVILKSAVGFLTGGVL
ncbi:MAG: hypothetical protein V1794_00135 [Candidatus Glassbacteria bacterium]